MFPFGFFFFFFFLSGEGEARVRGGAGEMDAKERAAPLPPAPPPPHSLVFVYLLCARHKADYTFVRSYFQKKEREGAKRTRFGRVTRDYMQILRAEFRGRICRFLGTVHRNEW